MLSAAKRVSLCECKPGRVTSGDQDESFAAWRSYKSTTNLDIGNQLDLTTSRVWDRARLGTGQIVRSTDPKLVT
jgi:hypothetical protein